jgi:two-component system, NtrC family, sensor histidine kinase PilS
MMDRLHPATTSDGAAPAGSDAPRPGTGFGEAGTRFRPIDLLRWHLLARMALVSGILVAALLVWRQADPQQTMMVTVLFISAVAVTGWAVWRTSFRGSTPDRTFLNAQMAFDALMITGVVHVTGGLGSVFAALYIPLIGVTAVFLPFPGVAIIGALCAILYLAEAVWGHGVDAFSAGMLLQVALFGVVAAIAGVLGDRLRRTGAALGEVESELRRLRLDTGDILAAVESGILTVDEDGRLVYLNPAGERLLGLNARQWKDAPVLDAVEQVAPQLCQLLRRALAERRSMSRETANAIRDDDRKVLGVSITLREVEGEPASATAVFQDITAAERLAMLNRQNERLQAVEALSASMAHEIKNPLASIRSAVEQFDTPRLAAEDRSRLTRMVVRESERLSRLLSDFIDFSRVRTANLERVDLRDVLSDAVLVARQHPDAEQGEVTVEFRPPAAPVVVDADSDVLHRAFLNLILNAIQFSPPGAIVGVRLEDLRGRGHASELGVEDPVCVRIRDRGPGIAEEDLSRVFDPFFTTREGGSGLGLAMVHRATEAHRGAVVVDRPLGGGSEFIMYLPGELGLPAEEEIRMSASMPDTEVGNV